MVWIKLRPDSYLNSELITSIDCIKTDYGAIGIKDLLYGTQIICYYGEFSGETYPNGIVLWDLEGLPKIKSHEEISETAREILGRLIIELESAKKNGDAIFDIDGFIEGCCIKYQLCRNPQPPEENLRRL